MSKGRKDCSELVASKRAFGTGGVVLIGNYMTKEPADRVSFSLDQGACWHTILLSEAIDISNIRHTTFLTNLSWTQSLFTPLHQRWSQY